MEAHDPVNNRTLDLSGNNRHLTFGNGATVSTFPIKRPNDRGYAVATVSSSVRYFERPGFQEWAAPELTVECLCMAYPKTSGWPVELGTGAAPLTHSFGFACSGSLSGRNDFYTGPLTSRYFENTGRTPQGVMHMVGQRNDTTSSGSLTVNGRKSVLVTGAPGNAQINTGVDFIVGSSRTLGSPYRGWIFLVRLWDIALSDVEIQELYRKAREELHRI